VYGLISRPLLHTWQNGWCHAGNVGNIWRNQREIDIC